MKSNLFRDVKFPPFEKIAAGAYCIVLASTTPILFIFGVIPLGALIFWAFLMGLCMIGLGMAFFPWSAGKKASREIDAIKINTIEMPAQVRGTELGNELARILAYQGVKLDKKEACEVLGVKDLQDAKKSYHKKALLLHPDRNSQLSPEVKERLVRAMGILNAANEITYPKPRRF